MLPLQPKQMISALPIGGSQSVDMRYRNLNRTDETVEDAKDI